MAKIEVVPEINVVLKEYAHEKGCTVDEAAERLITTAVGRLSAVRKYAEAKAKERVPAKPKAKAPKAKAPKAKAPKAKADAPAATA